MNKSITQALKESICGPIKDIVEIALDSVTDNEIIKEIPVINWIAGFYNGVISIKDKLYFEKILSFIKETSKANKVDRNKFIEKTNKDLEGWDKTGKIVLDIIDKLTSADKAVIIGKLFRAYMHENDMSSDHLIHLCEIVERTYLEDLINLKKDKFENESNLEAVGIQKPIRHEDIDILTNNILKVAEWYSIQIKPYPFEELKANVKIARSGLTQEGYDIQRIMREY
jgi:Cdc6-like AAA superfamily ATPase